MARGLGLGTKAAPAHYSVHPHPVLKLMRPLPGGTSKKKKNWSWESFYVLLKQKNSYCEQEETNYDPKRKKHNLYSQTGSAVILLLRQKRFSSCPAIRAANGNVKA